MKRYGRKRTDVFLVILGIKIKRENKGIVITQSHYIEKILKKFNREDCSPVSTPMDPVEKLKPNTGKPVDQLEYSRAIGCLMYAMTSTRPDIAYAVGRLSRFTSNPSRQHWKAITRVFKYLRGTKDYGLSYVGYPSVLEGYSDASWINHVEDSSSTSGWVFLLGGGAISWASKKQTCITSSTMESEFVALAAAVARAYSQIYNGKSRHLGVRHIARSKGTTYVNMKFSRFKKLGLSFLYVHAASKRTTCPNKPFAAALTPVSLRPTRDAGKLSRQEMCLSRPLLVACQNMFWNRSYEDDVAKISISIYVSNLPETFSAKDLFHACNKYGHVVDSFIPLKRSKEGKRFGFVKFINVSNVERLDSSVAPATEKSVVNLPRVSLPMNENIENVINAMEPLQDKISEDLLCDVGHKLWEYNMADARKLRGLGNQSKKPVLLLRLSGGFYVVGSNSFVKDQCHHFSDIFCECVRSFGIGFLTLLLRFLLRGWDMTLECDVTLMEHDFVNAIREFSSQVSSLLDVIHPYIALIPKKHDAKFVKDYRPISLARLWRMPSLWHRLIADFIWPIVLLLFTKVRCFQSYPLDDCILERANSLVPQKQRSLPRLYETTVARGGRRSSFYHLVELLGLILSLYPSNDRWAMASWDLSARTLWRKLSDGGKLIYPDFSLLRSNAIALLQKYSVFLIAQKVMLVGVFFVMWWHDLEIPLYTYCFLVLDISECLELLFDDLVSVGGCGVPYCWINAFLVGLRDGGGGGLGPF
ncbi:zinc finger, CCHC-type containing protein [Tanacetum coccineum]|uniref:Zinc finger, CCHC-type containing protein n=1 Tax=Tanacetum coccineum TaxID=301880 RepID=A0ABQ5IR39_9ASTR